MSWEMCLILFSVFTGRAVNGWEGFCLKCVAEDIDWQELMKVQRTQIWTVFHSFPNQPLNNDCGLTVATIINNKVCHMCMKKNNQTNVNLMLKTMGCPKCNWKEKSHVLEILCMHSLTCNSPWMDFVLLRCSFTHRVIFKTLNSFVIWIRQRQQWLSAE